MKRLIKVAVSGAVFTMCNGGPAPAGCCDRGDQLNVVMHPGVPNISDIIECESWSGELIYDPRTNISTCEEVDF